MKPKYNTILVTCPGNATTAGPEAIHQLVSDLNRIGAPAAVVYFPFNKKFTTPEEYKKYQAPVKGYSDNLGDLIIFPEIVTTYALCVKNADAAIWWMSVNNFTCERYGNIFRDKFRYFKNLLKGLRPLKGIIALKDLTHYAQSHYAQNFLKINGITSSFLSDPIPFYTEQSYLASLNLSEFFNRKNLILYNPNKGRKFNQYLINRFKKYSFFPLQGYNRNELAEIFLKSKLYIDFGHHPGKDRLPREAAIHGCCVITGVHGSAQNSFDINIPTQYKIDSKNNNFDELFEIQVNRIFSSYEECSKDFKDYRATISNEQIEFDKQIINNFFEKIN